MAKRQMSEAEFSAVKILLGIARPFSEEKIELARLVLVEGKSMSEVARIHGTTKQNFQVVVSKIDRFLDLYNEAKKIEAMSLETMQSQRKKSKKPTTKE